MNKAKYIRVSTAEQNTARQKNNIVGFKVYQDACSGSVSFNERKEAQNLLFDIERGLITEVHIHSIDRLGRDTVDVLTTIQNLTAKGVNLVSEKEGLHTLNPDGTENPVAKLVIGILATVSEMELNRITERRAEGIALAKERGVYKGNGRKEGEVEDVEKFLSKPKTQKIIKLLKQGRSVREAAKLADASTGTVQKVKKYVVDAVRSSNKKQEEEVEYRPFIKD